MGTPEADAIPYEPQDLRGERLLVLAPHPDDEVIGCGGVVAHHLREGRRVEVVVATNGGAAGNEVEREEESRKALAHLLEATKRDPAPGSRHPSLTFLRFPDRQLSDHADALQTRLTGILREMRPDLILVPSPIEIHPDHLALAMAFCATIQGDPALFAEAATARVAFYEVGQPIRPNALVDISDVAEAKYAAIAEHASQTAIRDYVSYVRGLNAYRSMTLAGTTAVEAYYVVPLPSLRTTPFSELRRLVGEPPRAEVVVEPLPLSVIVRTKDRPALLAEAIASIRATGYPCEIVVVNDGGARPELEGATLIDHETSRGRSEAANAGVREAAKAYICFLDDDDLFYPEHPETLAAASRRVPQAQGWYSDAVSAFVAHGETEMRLRLFSRDYDEALLLADNYIPLPTLLLRRETFLDLGGFDPTIDLFEDWDFLIRLSARGPFSHVPRITCEIRHIREAGSITMANPEGSKAFREAKLRVWAKHKDRITPDVFAQALETQKRELAARTSEAVEARGARHLLETAQARTEREKRDLVSETAALHSRIGGLTLEAASLSSANGTLHETLAAAQTQRDELLVRVGELLERCGHLGDHKEAFEEAQRTIAVLYAEIGRLQGLLDTIYGSRTWKLHTIVERLKGRH